MTAPSSPVPAVESILDDVIAAATGLHDCRAAHGRGHATDNDLRRAQVRLMGVRETATSALTPTPGRAAEPDAMAEVERCISTAISEAQIAGQFGEGGFAQHWADKTLSAVRTIVTEREVAWSEYSDLSCALGFPNGGPHSEIKEAITALRTRAETAEAQLATRGWQDISTAPRDGTEVLLWAEAWENSWGVQRGSYRFSEWECQEGSVKDNDPDFDPDAEVDEDFDPEDDTNLGPTHWQPLPEPPLSTFGADR